MASDRALSNGGGARILEVDYQLTGVRSVAHAFLQLANGAKDLHEGAPFAFGYKRPGVDFLKTKAFEGIGDSRSLLAGPPDL